MDSDLIQRILYFKEEPIKGINEERLDEVAYSPTTKHWYYDSYTFPVDYYPTKCGDIDPKSLTKRMKAKRFFGLNIEHFTSYDVLLFKDARDRIAVFTMVATASDMGSLWRTDHKGFGYKKVHFFIDAKGYHRPGANHYMTTEDLDGKWALVCILKTRDWIDGAYNEFTKRHCLAKGFSSEAEALDWFKNVRNGADLTDTEVFAYFDPEDPALANRL